MSYLASIVVPFLSTTGLQELILTWGYGVVFMAMLLESAGLPLPGETITLISGYADGSGQLKVLGVIAAVASGAIIGDSLGYWIGRRAGWPLLLRMGALLHQSPEQLESYRLRFLRHAGKSVFLGRFVAVGMPYLRFLIFNCAGAVLWASTMVTLAWLGGRWVPLNRMLEGVVEFGIGALVWWESSQLDSGDAP